MVRISRGGEALLAAIMALVVVAAPVIARAQITTTTEFITDAAEPAPTGPQVARKNATLMTLAVRSTRAVRLESGLDATATNWMGGKVKRPFQAGDILIAAGNRAGVFCAPVKEGAWYAISACLTDADGDGLFETAGTAAFNSARVDDILVTDKAALLGVRYEKPMPLQTPVRYASVGYETAPFARARLRWLSSFRADKPVDVIRVALWFDASDGSSGTAILSPPVQKDLPGGVGVIEVEGVTVRVLGFEANGALRYEIESVAAARKATFGYRPAPTTLYFYY